MNKKYEYDAVIMSSGSSGGAYVPFPYDVKAEFKKGRRLFMQPLTANPMTEVLLIWA